MKYLVIMAHGSRRKESNEHFEQLVSQAANQLADNYAAVLPCFLEMATPKFLDVVADAVQQGATQIDLFPMFLGPGNHVKQDIPEEIAHAGEKYPQCQFRQLDYLGGRSDFADILANSIKTAANG